MEQYTPQNPTILPCQESESISWHNQLHKKSFPLSCQNHGSHHIVDTRQPVFNQVGAVESICSTQVHSGREITTHNFNNILILPQYYIRT